MVQKIGTTNGENMNWIVNRRTRLLGKALLAGWIVAAFFQDSAFAESQRLLAPWPPPSGSLRVIIDTDAGNEIDDQYALALALGSPQRLHIEGIIAANFGESGGVQGIEKSYQEVQRVLQKAGMTGKIPVKRGADPLIYRDQAVHSDGVDFIIQEARSASPESPVWLVMLGPATDAAAALLKDPGIADRMVVFWHGRTQWPVRCWNFNAYNDILAARLLFKLNCRLVLFDTGEHLLISPDEGERRFGSLGPLGAYLQDIRHRQAWLMDPRKGIFDLGDIAALVDPSIAPWEKDDAPAVTEDLRYDFTKNYGPMVRIYYIEPAPAFQLLEQALKRIQDSMARQ
jgi:purine nucleosidase